ncbi:MAG: hypothetical protein IJM25_11905 [Eubacterium sp.]|nr:hypothetical protein [Eubacterium sp.]
MATKAELISERDSKQSQIDSYNAELAVLREKYSRLQIAYNRLHAILGEHFESYPDSTVVLDPYVYDESWMGDTKNDFYYNIYDIYMNSNAKMANDMLDARDWIAYEQGQVDDEIDSINWKKWRLEDQVDSLNRKIANAKD